MGKGNILLELYLVRHGESMSNIGAQEVLPPERQGDPSLSPKGIRQVQLLGEYLSDLPFDHILASGL
ncbi:MAG: histidine phosphatase family protein, partial [Oscillospiraceae bacterium]|nr:histidine phosphatase family protein [Oscillospiraceae bacterium]